MNVILTDTAALTEGKGIVLRTQNRQDIGRLEAVVPKDQIRHFRASWDGNCLKLEPFTPAAAAAGTPAPGAADAGSAPATSDDEAEVIRLKAMSREELETLATERGVKWPKNASLDTIARRIAEAAQAIP